MAGYLVAEEGPLEGLIIEFEGGSEWILGRDPDESSIVLEDPKASRKHVICHLTEEGYTLENLSSINPATQNGKVITEQVTLKEGDILEIGSTFFRFTNEKPKTEKDTLILEEETDTIEEEEPPLASFDYDLPPPSRWLIKVISGPNAGAEFALAPGGTYILGKDPDLCDVVFYDLSVSAQHARLSILEDETVFIEDLQSKNGVYINGEKISDKTEVSSQDLVALGTTSFLAIDREKTQDTIQAAPPSSIEAVSSSPAETQAATLELAEETTAAKKEDKNWKEMIIPQKHLVYGGIFVLMVLGLIVSALSLFQSSPIETPHIDEKEALATALKPFPSVDFSFNESTGKLFLIGHVLTEVDKKELTYTLSTLPFIESVEDTVIIDELVWQNINAILLTQSHWQAVSLHSPMAGQFILRGYVQTPEEAENLSDYMNSHFPYLNKLENHVNVANTLTLQIETLFLQHGFRSIAFNLSGGDLIVTGNVDQKRASDFAETLKEIKKLPGVLSLKNLVVYLSSAEGSAVIDLTKKYKVSGYSSGDNDMQFAIINTKVFETGDIIDGMMITSIEPEQVLLEKDGIKFKINYNLQ